LGDSRRKTLDVGWVDVPVGPLAKHAEGLGERYTRHLGRKVKE
jgi:hypothetical protein